MKRIQFVKTIELENVNGDPLLNETGGGRATCSQLEFFRGRVSDSVFIEGSDSGDGIDLQYEARRALRLQAEEAEALGYWELEDEPAKRLLAATNKGAYHKSLAFNLVPFVRAVRAMASPPEAAPAS